MRKWIRLLILVQVLALVVCITGLIDHTTAQEEPQVEFVGAHEYRQVDGKWYNYNNGEQGSQILPCRLILRLKNRGELTTSTFNAMGIHDVSISSRRFLDGYYVVEDDYEVGTNSIAAPVKDFSGNIIAALALVIPSVRFSQEHKKKMIDLVVNIADEFSRTLGYKSE